MRVPRVQSEALNGATYDPERRLLTVEFESGSVYEYFDVEPELFAELEAAQPHPWRVVGARVKEHDYRRVR
jgi:hypothetical protein